MDPVLIGLLGLIHTGDKIDFISVNFITNMYATLWHNCSKRYLLLF